MREVSHLEALASEQQIKVLKVQDLDPREKAELLDLLDFAMDNDAYIRVEVRKLVPMASMEGVH